MCRFRALHCERINGAQSRRARTIAAADAFPVTSLARVPGAARPARECTTCRCTGLVVLECSVSLRESAVQTDTSKRELQPAMRHSKPPDIGAARYAGGGRYGEQSRYLRESVAEAHHDLKQSPGKPRRPRHGFRAPAMAHPDAARDGLEKPRHAAPGFEIAALVATIASWSPHRASRHPSPWPTRLSAERKSNHTAMIESKLTQSERTRSPEIQGFNQRP